MNFKRWFEASLLDHEPTWKDALNVFFNPAKSDGDISPASIIDAELTPSHVPFIYLQDKDDIYEGRGNDYHHDIIMANKHDFELSSLLSKAYGQPFGRSAGIASAVGRMGYRLDFDAIKRRLPKDNIKLLMKGKEPAGISPEMKEIENRDFAMSLFLPASPTLKRLFSSIDIIAIYSKECTIEIAARAVQLLQDKESINDLNKTVVMYGGQPYMASEFITHARKPEQEEPVVTQTTAPKEKMPIYGKDFKPSDWKRAFRSIGVEPTIGDSTVYKGKNYHG